MDTFLTSLNLKKISLAPGQSMTLHVRFTAPIGLAGGTYNLIAATHGVTQTPDSNLLNDVAVTTTV